MNVPILIVQKVLVFFAPIMENVIAVGVSAILAGVEKHATAIQGRTIALITVRNYFKL